MPNSPYSLEAFGDANVRRIICNGEIVGFVQRYSNGSWAGADKNMQRNAPHARTPKEALSKWRSANVAQIKPERNE